MRVSALSVPSHRVLSWWQGSEARAACAIANKAHRDPQHQRFCTISHPLSHYSRHLYYSSHSLAVDRSSDDCWVCQAIVPPTTRPHRHQNSPGDRSSASQEYLHLSSQNKHPSVHPTAATTPPAYRTPLCETSQRHSFRKKPLKDPPSAFHLTIHSLPSTLKQLLSHAVGPSN